MKSPPRCASCWPESHDFFLSRPTPRSHRPPRLATARNTQLDGWRAFAVLGVIWLHWAPREWRGDLPFEIGLFFFLTLTGFLITGGLLRDRARGEATGRPWRKAALRDFFKRRATRILLPCYVAMLFAWLCGAPDLRDHPLPYLTHWVNFHIAMLPSWPSGTAHYWTLAIQVQFYLLWPFIVHSIPKRALAWLFAAMVALAPLTRWLLLHHFPQVHHPGAITSAAADYLGMGALLALAMERGMPAGDQRLARAAGIAAIAYLALYSFEQTGHPLPGLRHFQQSLVALAFAGLISATLRGIRGPLGRALEHPTVQHIGRLSYGLYLFHTPMPLALGFVLPFLWHPALDGPLLAIRLAVFGLASWAAAWLCWRYLEQAPGRRTRQNR
ncbi:MAG: acyltransferase [Verrucomicrobia bacterium]|nr:MAG: acyltransferase [Verrucomicrobiota bacterium]TAE88396.1 MAG: acyltransferase [Verrucomicrobiota bacterium]TAF26850.1 MAG: acyltransferase [Verrucomicrobiota bacterium]TAF42108.1 MAG: acyltransferase [Verrucomicrobiota bacterium]